MRLRRHYWLKAIAAFIILISIQYVNYYIDGAPPSLECFKNIIVFYMYFLLLISWGVSFNKRIRTTKIKLYLNLILMLMVIWLFIRSIKWYLPLSSLWSRITWYMYYFPMIFIPLLELYATHHMHKPENYVLGKKYLHLCIIGAVLFLLVLTNDCHQFVFSFENIEDFNNYSYNWGYYLVVLWSGILTVISIVFIISKCATSINGIKKFIPFVFLILDAIYCIDYINDGFLGNHIELMVAFDWTIIMLWETCVELDMIPVNKFQMDFFKNSLLKFVITDKLGNILASSIGFIPLNENDFSDLVDDKVLIKNHNRYHIYRIKCGYMIWQEDVREIYTLIERLKNDEQELLEGNTLMEEEIKAKNRQEKIRETNRLYNMLMTEMEGALTYIEDLSEELKETEDVCECYKILSHINVVGVYLKRRSNLIMLAEAGQPIDEAELNKAFTELFSNLLLTGMEGDFKLDFTKDFSKDELLEAFDYLQVVIEKHIFKGKKISLSITDKTDGAALFIDVDGQKYEYEICGGGV